MYFSFRTGQLLQSLDERNLCGQAGYGKLSDAYKDGGREKSEGDILALDVSADYIVYIDTKKDTAMADGGVIPGRAIMYLYNRSTQQTEKLKDIPYDCPDVFLTGQYVVWVERTGETQDKLYMMDLTTKEVTTLGDVQDSPMGVSPPGVCSTDIVWVEPHPDQPDSEQYNVIKTLSLGENAGTVTTYEPGMYAFKPMTNGSAIIWSDNVASADANLYLSQNGAMPKKLAENVSGYGIADKLVAYCQNGRIYVYFLATGELAQLSKSTEYAMLADVSSHGVTWFDITDQKQGTRYFEIRGGGLKDDGKNKNDFLLHKLRA